MPRLHKSAPKSQKRVVMHREMHKFKHGTLRSGTGVKGQKQKEPVTDPSQAIAIGLSESGQSKRKVGSRKRGKGKGKARRKGHGKR